jgi:hypothetical protein
MNVWRFPMASWLLTCALVWAGSATAGSRSRPDRFTIALPDPYDRVLDAVRDVASDGVIHGSAQYESEKEITGASAVESSPAFARWTGSGEALYKARPKTIAPSHFEGSRDIGTVMLRFIVEPAGPAQTRITIDAVFVEDSGHGRHLSQGIVEIAEFGEIAKRLKRVAGGEPQQKGAPDAGATK